jgi:hypothetical protein
MSSFSKQEYIHLHGLLAEVSNYSEQELDAPYEELEDVEKYRLYEELDVKPTSIHRNKSDHEEAVFLLADSITDFLEGENEVQVES